MILEMAADLHELMTLWCIMRPYIAMSANLDVWFAISRHTTAQSATLDLYPVT